jgi:hypothetical protein
MSTRRRMIWFPAANVVPITSCTSFALAIGSHTGIAGSGAHSPPPDPLGDERPMLFPWEEYLFEIKG